MPSPTIAVVYEEQHVHRLSKHGRDLLDVETDKFIVKNPEQLTNATFVSPHVEVDVQSVLCGFGSWRPRCLQRFANLSTFVVIYCVSMMFLGMPNSYFYAITSTIEKVFNVNSKVTGIVLIGNDVSQVLFSVVIGYVGAKGSRPLWMALGLAAVTISCFIYASNHYFWEGPAAALADTASVNQTATDLPDLCWATANNQSSSAMLQYHTRKANGGGANECPGEKPVNYIPMALFFLGQFVAGVGNTALLSLGVSYGDDHMKKKNTPMFLAMVMMSRLTGAFLGFIVAGVSLSYYIMPTENPHLSQSDPRWLGAWWLGFIVFGCCMAVCATLMAFLPKTLPPKAYKSVYTLETQIAHKGGAEPDQTKEADLTKLALKELIQTVLRLLRNPIFLFCLLSESVFFLYIGASQIYSSRYTETQFRQTASKASILTAIFSISIMTASCIGGSALFSRYRPSAKRVTGLNTAMRFGQVMLIIGQMMLSCDKVNYANVSIGHNRFEVNSSCSKACDCLGSFEPVCIGNATFLSPCLAGCTRYHAKGTQKRFYDCTCSSSSGVMPNNSHFDNWNNASSSSFPMAESGVCASKSCSAVTYYLALTSIINFFSAALYPASAVILIRSVDTADKSMAMALKLAGFCLIGFFPGPVIYGAVFDSACLLRESERCTGGQGNCWVYDVDLLRQRFLGTSATVIAVSAVLCLLLYNQVRKRNIILFDEDDDDDENMKNAKTESEMKPMSKC